MTTFNNCLQDIRLMLHKYTLLVNKGRLREYVGVGEELLAFLFREVHHRSDVKGTKFCFVVLHSCVSAHDCIWRERSDLDFYSHCHHVCEGLQVVYVAVVGSASSLNSFIPIPVPLWVRAWERGQVMFVFTYHIHTSPFPSLSPSSSTHLRFISNTSL